MLSYRLCTDQRTWVFGLERYINSHATSFDGRATWQFGAVSKRAPIQNLCIRWKILQVILGVRVTINQVIACAAVDAVIAAFTKDCIVAFTAKDSVVATIRRS